MLLQILTGNLSVQPQAPKTRQQVGGLRAWKDHRPLSQAHVGVPQDQAQGVGLTLTLSGGGLLG